MDFWTAFFVAFTVLALLGQSAALGRLRADVDRLRGQVNALAILEQEKGW